MRSFEISNDRLGVLHGLTQNDAPSPPLTQHHEVSNPPVNIRAPPPPAGNSNGVETSYATTTGDRGDTGDQSKSKFRFKKKHRSGRREDGLHHRGHHHQRSSSSHPPKRRRHTHHNEVKDDPSTYDDTYLPNASSFKYADPDKAFRQSLFDAMADDEGAAFWEGVYGQPINVYPRPELRDEKGELERMDDDEYAAYVREKMWEKSHQHITEEREKRERQKDKRKKRQDDQMRWNEAEKVRVGEDKQRRERKARNRLRKRWDGYLEDWARVVGGTRLDANYDREEGKGSTSLIPWPVESGKLSDLSQDTVEQFFLSTYTSTGSSSSDFINMLKLERVRWHPDKAQQRWGKGGLSDEELKGITAVFQAIDSLWIEHRDKKEGRRD